MLSEVGSVIDAKSNNYDEINTGDIKKGTDENSLKLRRAKINLICNIKIIHYQ